MNKKAAAREAELNRLREIARKTTNAASAESATLIVALGQERLKALQAGGIALDARITQVAAFQLAAAAVAAGLSAADRMGGWAAGFAAIGCLSFVVGSGLAFWGMHSCKNQVAGVEPSFWEGALSLPRFGIGLARCWAAEVTEECIFQARIVDEERAAWLNRSLIAGALGAAAILVGVGFNLWDRWNDQRQGAPSPRAAAAAGVQGTGGTDEGAGPQQKAPSNAFKRAPAAETAQETP